MLWAHSHEGWQTSQGMCGCQPGTGTVQVGEVWQGLTLQVENPRKGKLDMWSIHSSAVFLVGKDGVSIARKAEPVLGTVMREWF